MAVPRRLPTRSTPCAHGRTTCAYCPPERKPRQRSRPCASCGRGRRIAGRTVCETCAGVGIEAPGLPEVS
jgi:hypothetical protein